MATYKPIQSIVLGSDTSSVTFSNIPQDYSDLIISITGTTTTASDNNYMQYNYDTSSLYSTTYAGGDGSTPSSGRQTGQNKILLDGPAFWSTDQGNKKTIHIQNYSNTTVFKTNLTRAVSTVGSDMSVGLYRSTSAITSIVFLTDVSFASGSTFDLYGIKSGAPSALGGDVVTTDGNYWYHTFNTTQTFTTLKPLTVDYLVVAGGGGGGGGNEPGGGGAGAGGYRTSIGGSALSLTAQNYAVTVGAGGAGGIRVLGNNGNNSVFSTITSTGGGCGAGSIGTNTVTSGNGGSGGGGARPGSPNTNMAGGSGNTPSTSPSQGNNGGNGRHIGGTASLGGGGGGASAVGQNASDVNRGGDGGAGSANSISGSSVTYAGGGGGGADTGNNGAGGVGGGAAGGSPPTAATANTGGGGGGTSSYNQNGSNGGSGVVIVRYSV